MMKGMYRITYSNHPFHEFGSSKAGAKALLKKAFPSGPIVAFKPYRWNDDWTTITVEDKATGLTATITKE